VEHLVELARTLYGRSGISFGGANPLSPLVVESYVRQMELGPLHPWEFEALLILDAALSYKETDNTEDSVLPSSIEE
jgi:hypothetical protein